MNNNKLSKFMFAAVILVSLAVVYFIYTGFNHKPLYLPIVLIIISLIPFIYFYQKSIARYKSIR